MKLKLLIPIFVMIFLASAVNAFVISGQVTDTDTNPINNSHVEVFDAASALVNETYTNESGDYSVEVGNLLRTVQASAAGYDDQSTPIFVNSDKVVNFALGPIQAVTLSGYVVDNSTTNPLNNVDISVKQGGATFTETSTNAAGFYSVNVIDGQAYDVTASLLDYITEAGSVTINNNTELNFSLAPVSTLVCTDNDGDGYAIEGGDCGLADCDDNNPLVNPGATETGNGIDDNCDGSVDEGFYNPPPNNDDDDDDDGGSSSSGSRGSFYQIPIVYEEEFDDNGEIIKELFRINILKFPVGDAIHQLEVVSVFIDKATLIISSAPITFSLNIGHGKEFDLTGDGVNDVSITLLERIHSRIVVKIKLLNQAAASSSGSETSDQTVSTDSDSDTTQTTTATTGTESAKIMGSFLLVDFIKATKGGLYITLGTILVGLIVYFIFFRSKIIEEQGY